MNKEPGVASGAAISRYFLDRVENPIIVPMMFAQLDRRLIYLPLIRLPKERP
jgi:hypothetical protein